MNEKLKVEMVNLKFLALALALFLCSVPLFGAGAPEERRVLIEYFFQPGCPECEKVKAFILPVLDEDFKESYKLIEFDVNVPENIPKLADYQNIFNDLKDEPVSMVLDGKVFLNGYDEIESKLFEEISKLLASPSAEPAKSKTPVKKSSEPVRERLRSFTIPAIATAGFIDGINPCVFSTLVFFISLLGVSKIKGSRLLLAGSVYCATCFASYFALGFGVFRFIRLFSEYESLRTALNFSMAGLLALFAFLSLRDAWIFKKSGEAKDITLQLPDKLKKIVHRVMRKGLSLRYLIPGAVFIGVTVTAIESVCTGQVYVPTLVYLSRLGDIKALYLLSLYNAAFIVPLLVVFTLAYRGISTPKLVNWSKRNVVPAKILLALFFVCMAVLILTL